jgi:hypothetical protein
MIPTDKLLFVQSSFYLVGPRLLSSFLFSLGLFAKALTGVDVKDLITKIGSSAGSAPAAGASSAGGGAAPAEEEKKGKCQVHERKRRVSVKFMKFLVLYSQRM